MTDFDETDIHAMRQQGDLKAFMRQLIRPTRPTATPTPRRARPRPPDRNPGTWPAGSHPPGPDPDPPSPAECQRALTEYREWLANDPAAKEPIP